VGDGGAQLRVGDAGDLGAQVAGERDLGGRGADFVARRGALGGIDVADAEAQGVDGDAAGAELGADGLGEHGELLRPGRRGGAHVEDAAVEAERAGARGDAAADGGFPVAVGDGGGLDGAGDAEGRVAVQDAAEGLEAAESRAALHADG
jgi:hypothetical protein